MVQGTARAKLKGGEEAGALVAQEDFSGANQSTRAGGRRRAGCGGRGSIVEVM